MGKTLAIAPTAAGTASTLAMPTPAPAPARHLPWWERGEAWRFADTWESRERARLAGLVWSTRTRQWMTVAAKRDEDRQAAISYTEARRAYHTQWAWWTPALG